MKEFDPRCNILLVDRTFTPLRAIPRKRARKLEYLQKAFFLTPFLIQLQHYVHRPFVFVRYTRRGVYARDQNICQYCGEVLSVSNRTIDHIIPLVKGGRSSFENCVTCCQRCNRRKGRKTLQEVGFSLSRRPRNPHLLDVLQGRHNQLWLQFQEYLKSQI